MLWVCSCWWLSCLHRGDQTRQSLRKWTLDIHWKDCCWSWSANTLTTWCESHRKRPWCWGRLKAKGDKGGRGWDGWMASPTQQIWIWGNSGRWWKAEEAGALQSVQALRVRHSDWAPTTFILLCYMVATCHCPTAQHDLPAPLSAHVDHETVGGG